MPPRPLVRRLRIRRFSNNSFARGLVQSSVEGSVEVFLRGSMEFVRVSVRGSVRGSVGVPWGFREGFLGDVPCGVPRRVREVSVGHGLARARVPCCEDQNHGLLLALWLMV